MPYYEQTTVSTGTFTYQLPTGTAIFGNDIFPFVHGITGSSNPNQMQQASFILLNSFLKDHFVSGSWSQLQSRFVSGSWTQLQGTFQPSGTTPFLTSYIEGAELQYNHATGTAVGSGRVHAENGDIINITGSISTVHSGLTINSWYHAYAYLNAGVPSVEYSTTVPANPYKGNSRSKTGDTSKRYVGSMMVNSTGGVRKFQHNIHSNTMYYVNFAADQAPFRALSNGKNGTATAASLTGTVPITSNEVFIRITNLAYASLFTSNDSGVGVVTEHVVALTAGNTSAQSAFLFHPIDSSQQIWYMYPAAITGSFNGAFGDVMGYNFER